MSENITTYKVGDGLEVLLEGIPKSIITPEQQASTALQIIKHAIPVAASVTPGIIGSVQTAVLKVAGQHYTIKYAMRATRVIRAAEIYSQAIHYIQFEQQHNRITKELADSAISHLHMLFEEEFPNRRSLR
jgi:hypothetical protein